MNRFRISSLPTYFHFSGPSKLPCCWLISLSPKGSGINSVVSDPIWIPLQICGGHLPDQIPEFGKNTLTKRAGQPAELEDIYIFLASDESGYITAEIFGINKGVHI
ncbi:SDR family oxidoreductase [Oxalobacter aliiformigenes]|uniref:SDR family oxidoreductase n=1 Tax=Oxalobacter aliiformigenes TaxID=2946593 RepID=UPI0038B3B0AB